MKIQLNFKDILNEGKNLLSKIIGLDRRWFNLISFFLILIVYVIIGKDVVSTVYLWAEDGNIFLQQAIDLGWNSIFTVYAGYLHLLPRLVTLFAFSMGSPFNNLVLIATIMKWCTILLSTLILWYFTTDDFEWLIKNRWARLATVLYIPILMTLFSETYGTITNIQWWSGIFVFIVGLNLIRGKFPPLWVCILLFLMSLSTPYSPIIIILLGIYLFQRIRNLYPTKISKIVSGLPIKEIITIIAIVIAVVIQVYFVLSSAGGRVKFDIWVSPVSSLIDYFSMYFRTYASSQYLLIPTVVGGVQNIFSLTVPNILNYISLPRLGIVIFLFITITLFWAKRGWIAIYLGLFVALYIGLAFYTNGPIFSYMRYYAAPSIAVWIMLFISLYLLYEKIPSKKVKIIFTILFVCVLLYIIFISGGMPLQTSYGHWILEINQYVNFESPYREWVGIAPQWTGTHWGINVPMNPH